MTGKNKINKQPTTLRSGFSQTSSSTSLKQFNSSHDLTVGVFSNYYKTTNTSVLRAFTMIELLIVMTIIGILATTLVVILRPATMLARARDSQRDSDVNSIVMLVRQYASDHSGTLPDTDGDPETSDFPTSLTCIGTDPSCFDLASAGDDDESIVPDYSASLPKDPKIGTEGNIGYTIMVDSYNHITASASGETRIIGVTK